MSCLCLLAQVLGKKTGVGLMEFNSAFLVGLVSAAPNLVVWIVAIVLAAVLLRRGGGRAERFIIVGASLKLFANLLNIPAAAIVPWMVEGGATITHAASLMSGYEVLRGVIGAAGIIFIVCAFWVKFKGSQAP